MTRSAILSIIKKTFIPIFLTLLIIEAILWLGFPQGTAPTIDVHMVQEIPGLAKKVHFQKNHLGLRTNSIHQKKKDDDVFRIIILGASTAEQATQSNENTWGLLLEKNVQEALPEKNIEVGIYATGGMKTHELLRWANQNLVALQPDLVITLLGINNLSTDMVFANKGQNEHLMNYVNGKKTFLARIAHFSQIARYIKNIQNNAKRLKYTRENNGANFDVAGLDYFRSLYHHTPIVEAPEQFPTNLFSQQTSWLFKLLDSHNIPSLTLTQPSLFKKELDYIQKGTSRIFKDQSIAPEAQQALIKELLSLWFILNDGDKYLRLQPSDMKRGLEQYNTKQLQLAAQFNRASFPLHNQLEPTAENFFDDCHFTDLGSKRIADLITPSVLEIINNQ